jgi:hypothetical protein
LYFKKTSPKALAFAQFLLNAILNIFNTLQDIIAKGGFAGYKTFYLYFLPLLYIKYCIDFLAVINAYFFYLS